MIDPQGYRLNIGIILVSRDNQVFWGRRSNQPQAWQCPQGGIQAGETFHEAMYRELYEETGLPAEAVQVLKLSPHWRVYHLPKRFRRYHVKPLCIGQKQRWFLLRLLADDTAINLQASSEPEFDQWQWVSYWHPADHVVAFKRPVYRSVLNEFAQTLFPDSASSDSC